MCTGIKIISKTNDIFMDVRWILRLTFWQRRSNCTKNPYSNCSISKGTVLNSQLNPWTAKYAFMGLAMSGTDQPANDGKTVSLAITDGINEAGLSGDIQYLMESSTAPAESLADRGLTPHIAEEVLAYILSNFESVDEVKVAFEKIGLLDQKFQLDSLGKFISPYTGPLMIKIIIVSFCNQQITERSSFMIRLA